MFKVMFKVERQNRDYNSKDGGHIKEMGRGHFVCGKYSIARQIKDSLDGIAFDNPGDDMLTAIVGQINTGNGNINVNLDMIAYIHESLARLEESMTEPDESRFATAAE